MFSVAIATGSLSRSVYDEHLKSLNLLCSQALIIGEASTASEATLVDVH